jgi:hypothetical protein
LWHMYVTSWSLFININRSCSRYAITNSLFLYGLSIQQHCQEYM